MEKAEGAGSGLEAGVPGGECGDGECEAGELLGALAEAPGRRGCLGAELERVIPFFQFPEVIRRVIYTTNAVEICI